MPRLAGWNCGAALLALLVSAPLASAAPVPPGKNALALVPEKAPLVLYLHGIERTRERFLTTLKASLPDQAAEVEKQLDMLLKDGVEGHKLDGLEKDGPIFLAFLEMPRDFAKPPKMAFIVAVADYAKFRDGLLDTEQKKALKKGENGVEEAPLPWGDEKVYFLDRKGWAIVGPDKESVETFAAKDFKGLDSRISKDQGGKMLDADIAVYLSMDAFNKDYAEQIAVAKKAFAEQLLPQLENAGTLDKATIQIYKAMVEGAFQAAEDSQGILLTVEFRPTGLAIHLQTELRSDTPTSKTLKPFQTSSFADLNRLPSGQAYYTGLRPSADLLAAVAPLMFGVHGDPKMEENKAIKAAIDKIVKAGPQETLNSVSVPTAGVQVIKFKDAAQGLEGQLDLLRAIQAGTAYQQVVVKDKPAIKLKAEQYHNIEFHAVEVKLDLEKTLDRTGLKDAPDELKKSILTYYQKTVGDTIHTWMGTDGKVVVHVIAPDWKSAQKLLDAYFAGKRSLADDAAFKDLRKELPADATFYGAIDPVLYGTIFAEGFRLGIEGAAQGAFKLPANFPAKEEKHVTTYFGAAVTLKQERASVDLFFSTKGIAECYRAFGKPFLNNF